MKTVVWEWKIFWTGAITAVSTTLAVLSVFAGMPEWVAIILSFALVAGVLLISPSIIEATEMFRKTEGWQRRRVQVWSTAAATVFAAWVTTTVVLPIKPVYMLACLAGLLVIAPGCYWVARAVEWRLTKVDPPAPKNPVNVVTEPCDQVERVMHAALKRAGFGFLLPGGYERLGNDAGYKFTVQMPSWKIRSSGKDKNIKNADALPPSMAEAVAIALGELSGEKVPTNWVQVRKEDKIGAGVYTVTALERDVMGAVIPWADDPTPSTITEPKVVGYDAGGEPHREPLAQHSRNIGGTRYGKTSLIHVEIAEISRCPGDAMLWLGGVQKLYDLAAGWVEPYLGTGRRCPIDWIANGIEDTLEMMAAAMRVARWRQRQPMSKRSWRTLILMLDEFSFIADCKNKQIKFDGRWVTAADLVSMLLKGAASANVYVKLASQRDVIEHFGDKGGDVVANMQANYAFMSKDFASIGRMTGDYKLPAPTNKGEYWLLSEGSPLNLKAPYIQTIDPTQPVLHNGPTVADVSWARRDLVQGGLRISEGLEAAGAAYTDRYQVVDAAMIAYLTESAEVTETPVEETDAYQQTASALAQIKQKAGLTDAIHTNEGITTLNESKKRPELIVQILDDAPADGMSIADVTARLLELGDVDANPERVAATLSRMRKNGRITRPTEGVYAPNERTRTTIAA